MERQVSGQLLRPCHTEDASGSLGVDLPPQKSPGNVESPMTSRPIVHHWDSSPAPEVTLNIRRVGLGTGLDSGH